MLIVLGADEFDDNGRRETFFSGLLRAFLSLLPVYFARQPGGPFCVCFS
ncbi:hypothetical protein JMM63_18335 [Rhodovulum sulfidophilum]|nr:hypothetical protein [Rhodovulum sulfidophilum]MBL3597494.1 hypothetical protein [Rhodovulum sulfidophilum]